MLLFTFLLVCERHVASFDVNKLSVYWKEKFVKMSSDKIPELGYLNMSGISRQAPDSTYLDMSGRPSSELRPGELNSTEIPRLSQQKPETKVWIERVRQRRPMSSAEIAENFEFFEALEQERRSEKLCWLVLSIMWLAIFGVLLILIYFGIIPFCNL